MVVSSEISFEITIYNIVKSIIIHKKVDLYDEGKLKFMVKSI